MAEKLGLGTFINDSTELTAHGLDSFSVPPVDKILKEGKTVYYYPTTSITDSGPYEFIITKDPDHYIFLPQTRLEGVLQVTAADGTAFEDADKIAPVNLFPQAIFKQVECELNGTEVCDLSTPTYHYKSFLETHLTYGKSAKETHLYCSMYEKDTAGKEETYDGTNIGFKNRKKRMTTKKNIGFSNIIHSDFLQCHKYLIPNIDIKLKFIRNEDSLALIGDGAKNGKVVVKNLRLAVRKIKIDPHYQQALERQLASQPAIYNLTQSKIKTFNIPAASKSIEMPNIIQGNLPRSVHIGFVSSDGFNGDIKSNPFLFANQGINYFNLKVNGVPVCPTPFQPEFSTETAVREYRWFMDNCGIQHENETNDITFQDYLNNSCLWNFDLTPDLCNSFHLHETKTGSMDVTLAFTTELAKPIYMIVYACYNSAIAIDADRNVKVIN